MILTSPLTGETVKLEHVAGDVYIATNPLTGKDVQLMIRNGVISTDFQHFAHVPTVNAVKAAEILGVSKSRVSSLCKRGVLQNVKRDGLFTISVASIREYMANRAKS